MADNLAVGIGHIPHSKRRIGVGRAIIDTHLYLGIYLGIGIAWQGIKFYQKKFNQKTEKTEQKTIQRQAWHWHWALANIFSEKI